MFPQLHWLSGSGVRRGLGYVLRSGRVVRIRVGHLSPRVMESTSMASTCPLHPAHSATDTCERCGTFICGRCVGARCAACVQRERREAQLPIGGSVIPAGLWLVFEALKVLSGVVVSIQMTPFVLTDALHMPRFFLYRLFQLALVAYASVMLVGFFRRKRWIPSVVVGWGALSLLGWAYLFFLMGSPPNFHTPVFAALGASYFLFSPRVKRTFVR